MGLTGPLYGGLSTLSMTKKLGSVKRTTTKLYFTHGINHLARIQTRNRSSRVPLPPDENPSQFDPRSGPHVRSNSQCPAAHPRRTIPEKNMFLPANPTSLTRRTTDLFPGFPPQSAGFFPATRAFVTIFPLLYLHGIHPPNSQKAKFPNEPNPSHRNLPIVPNPGHPNNDFSGTIVSNAVT